MRSNILFSVFLAALPAVAQTNAPVKFPVVVTNMVSASDDFRKVDGQLYNIQKSKLWVELNLKFVRQNDGLVFSRIVTNQPTYETRYFPASGGLDANQRAGAYVPGGSGFRPAGYREVKTGEEKVLGKTIVLRNCRAKDLTTGDEFKAVAMRVGTHRDGEKIIELWDNGSPHIVPVISTNYLHAKP